MLWASAFITFFGFLRVSEFTSPSIKGQRGERGHISGSPTKPDHAIYPPKAVKMDQLRKTGQFLLCPVSAMLIHLVERGMAPGLPFQWSSGDHFTRASFVSEVKQALRTIWIRLTEPQLLDRSNLHSGCPRYGGQPD